MTELVTERMKEGEYTTIKRPKVTKNAEKSASLRGASLGKKWREAAMNAESDFSSIHLPSLTFIEGF